MPERINKLNRKIDSSEVQGKNSFVLMQAPTMGDIQAIALPNTTDKNANMEYAMFLLGRLVKNWNWVDDNGDPLSKPSEEVIMNLPYAEIKFLIDALGLEALTNQKN